MHDHPNHRIDLITVPYDSAHFGRRMGSGPLHLLERGLVERLQKEMHIVGQKRIDAEGSFHTEIATTFELLHKIKTSIASALDIKSFPIVLSGNCNASVGTIAGFKENNQGLIWFDAHGDCETPETTASGFLDGMALTMALGKCWHNKLAMLNNSPLPANRVVLIGARDLSEYEQDFISGSGMNYITVSQIRKRGKVVHHAVDQLIEAGVKNLHIHVDVDVFDSSVAPANSYSVPDGLTREEVIDAIRCCAGKIPLRSAAIASYDPSYDKDNQMLNVIYQVIDAFIACTLKNKGYSGRA